MTTPAEIAEVVAKLRESIAHQLKVVGGYPAWCEEARQACLLIERLDAARVEAERERDEARTYRGSVRHECGGGPSSCERCALDFAIALLRTRASSAELSLESCQRVNTELVREQRTNIERYQKAERELAELRGRIDRAPKCFPYMTDWTGTEYVRAEVSYSLHGTPLDGRQCYGMEYGQRVAIVPIPE